MSFSWTQHTTFNTSQEMEFTWWPYYTTQYPECAFTGIYFPNNDIVLPNLLQQYREGKFKVETRKTPLTTEKESMASKEEPTHDQGYPLEQFLEEIPDKYKCICCHKVAREIHMIECCRKQACLSCIKQYLNNQACPQCQEKDFSIVSLKKDNEKIANLLVKCVEKGKGWYDHFREDWVSLKNNTLVL